MIEQLRIEVGIKQLTDNISEVWATSCTTCGGTPHLSGIPCVCGGTGSIFQEIAGLRKALFDAQVEAQAHQREIGLLRQDRQAAYSVIDGQFWFWQGDGEDHLETLTCPVVIWPETLARIIDRAPLNAPGDKE